jgi:large conductance mechanosensitive channel
MKEMWNEFKKFAIQGNVLDLAVAVVIGAAFGKIVSSLVDHIIMPLVGMLLGGYSFEKLAFRAGDAAIQYGMFIQSIVDFFIIAGSIFIFIKMIGKIKWKQEKKEEETEEQLPSEIELLTEIRDLLKAGKKDMQDE